MALERGGAPARLPEPPFEACHERLGLPSRADQGAERTHHVEDAGDVALVEGMDRDVAADQLCGDVGLQVGEGENEIRFEREDFFKVGGGEGGNPRLLAAHPRAPHRVPRHADDAPRLAEEIKRLPGLLGEADNALGRKHYRSRFAKALLAASRWITT